VIIRRAAERGHAQLDWLQSWHSFSFADYHDPRYMNFGSLRVINEDVIAPAGGFPTHPHRDMEIITYLLEGQLKHRDSMGNGSVIQPGEVQRMSAGTGILHSEFNPSDESPCHLLQIWIVPDRSGHVPGYEQKRFESGRKRGRLCLVASRDGRDGSVTINQDARLYSALVDGAERIEFEVRPGRKAWIQVARGAVSVKGEALEQGDGCGLENAGTVVLDAGSSAEILLFDLADR
jgi:redox-sensitive bicupin YhaK (pirin superfamily)